MRRWLKRIAIATATVIYSGNGVTIGDAVLIAANCTLAATNHEIGDPDRRIPPQGAPAKGRDRCGKHQPGGNRKSSPMQEEDLYHETACDPGQRPRIVRVAFRKSAAPGLDRRRDGEEGKSARDQIGRGGGPDSRIARRPFHARGIEGDHAGDDR